MSDDKNGRPDNEIITRLHIPDELIDDPDKRLRMKTKRKKKSADAVQVLILLSLLLLVVGGLYALRINQTTLNWGIHWASGSRPTSNAGPDLTNISVGLLIGNLALCLVGLPLYFKKHKKSGPGAIYFAIAAVISIVSVAALLVW